MRCALQCGVLALALATCAMAGDRIDGIVAVVNSRPVLQSEWDDALRFERLMAAAPLGDTSEAERMAALERLIDQVLISQRMEASGYRSTSPEEVTARLAEVRRQHPWGSGERWSAALAQYGMTEAEVVERLAMQMNILRFIDQRFRSSVHVDRGAIESYYQSVFLPQVRSRGGQESPLAEVAGRIEELLLQEKIGEMTTSWLEALRKQSRIHRVPAAQMPGTERAEVR